MQTPSYLEAHRSGKLAQRVRALTERLAACDLCPRSCGVNRLEDEKGFCATGRRAVVSSFASHFGEEDPLVGSGGSGTIFFTHCNLRCGFCQNYEISHEGVGQEVPAEEIARAMLLLQGQGCHNINFVSPSHVVAQILEALPLAVEEGLRIPLVYNTGGYDSTETLAALDGIVDIYMPDVKFSSEAVAKEQANAADYPAVMRRAVEAMHAQVGDLRLDAEGVAFRGLLVRHLVMPDGMAGTREIMQWIAASLSRNTYLNIMDQYRPCGTAYRHASLGRRITRAEYEAAREAARENGLQRLDRRRPFRLIPR